MPAEPSLQLDSVASLIRAICDGAYGVLPEQIAVVGASWIYQTTQFSASSTKYQNRYLLLRVDAGFGACCHSEEQGQAHLAYELSGCSLRDLLCDPRLAVQIAALDAYCASVFPHSEVSTAQHILPAGSPIQRAQARDALIAELIDVQPGQQVALIGVVNPLVQAIRDRGAHCLPCDLTLRTTQWGDPIEPDMERVLAQADAVIATGMTLSNGSFDRLIERVRERDLPLLVYAQTGSAIVPRFLGQGVQAVLAEPFPFSQFSAAASSLFSYQQLASLSDV
jgi:hypothetical protein